MLPMDLTLGDSLSRLGPSVLIHHFWASTVAMIVIAATVSALFVLNLWIVEYRERGRLRRRTDGRTSSLLLVSLFIDGEIAFVGGLVMVYYILRMPLSIRHFLATASQQH